MTDESFAKLLLNFYFSRYPTYANFKAQSCVAFQRQCNKNSDQVVLTDDGIGNVQPDIKKERDKNDHDLHLDKEISLIDLDKFEVKEETLSTKCIPNFFCDSTSR